MVWAMAEQYHYVLFEHSESQLLHINTSEKTLNKNSELIIADAFFVVIVHYVRHFWTSHKREVKVDNVPDILLQNALLIQQEEVKRLGFGASTAAFFTPGFFFCNVHGPWLHLIYHRGAGLGRDECESYEAAALVHFQFEATV